MGVLSIVGYGVLLNFTLPERHDYDMLCTQNWQA